MEDFAEIINKDGYFVDKTLMIQNLIESNAKVTLFTRPRRFGKTLLFFSGYLKKVGERADTGGDLYLRMAIPNKEIKSIYKDSILLWFDKMIERTDRSPLIKALEGGDCEAAENFVNEQLLDTISYFDYAESFYHGVMAGMLKNTGKYLSFETLRHCNNFV